MDLHISFKGLDRSQALQVYTQEKSEKLKKYFRGKINVHWNFSVENLTKIAHCRLTGNGMDYFGEASSDDLHVSIDHAVDKIEKQLRRHKEIVKDHLHKQAHVGPVAAEATEAEEE